MNSATAVSGTEYPHGRAGTSDVVARALIAVGTLFPITAVSAACYSRNAGGGRSVRSFLAYALYISFMVALLNAGKFVEADEWVYQDFLRSIRLNVHNGFVRAVFDVSGRTEVGFYFISYPLYLLGGQSIKMVTVFWTFFIYGLTALSFARLFRNQLHTQQSLAIFVICAMVFVNFTLTAQVMRQYAAGALVLTAFAFYDRRILSLALIVFATAVHNSAVVFFLPWFYVLLRGLRLRKVHSAWFIIVVIAAAAAGGGVIFRVVEYLTGGLLGVFIGGLLDNGSITSFKVASIVLSVSVLWHEMRRRYDRKFVPVFYGLLSLLLVLAVVWQLPLFLLRFAFYIEFFAVISVAMLLFRLVRLAPSVSLLLLPALANAALIVRALKSPWTYTWLTDGVVANFSGALLTRVFAP